LVRPGPEVKRNGAHGSGDQPTMAAAVTVAAMAASRAAFPAAVENPRT
jgi:hypothetical protein